VPEDRRVGRQPSDRQLAHVTGKRPRAQHHPVDAVEPQALAKRMQLPRRVGFCPHKSFRSAVVSSAGQDRNSRPQDPPAPTATCSATSKVLEERPQTAGGCYCDATSDALSAPGPRSSRRTRISGRLPHATLPSAQRVGNNTQQIGLSTDGGSAVGLARPSTVATFLTIVAQTGKPVAT
jgi:hypothetical protein